MTGKTSGQALDLLVSVPEPVDEMMVWVTQVVALWAKSLDKAEKKEQIWKHFLPEACFSE